VLCAVAQRFVTITRPSDTLARLGGDEFAIILPHVHERQAREVAAGLLVALRGAAGTTSGSHARRLTASIGIALFHHGGDVPTSAELLVEADTAMYDAKEAGRAQIAVYDPDNVRQTGMEARLDVAEPVQSARLERDHVGAPRRRRASRATSRSSKGSLRPAIS